MLALTLAAGTVSGVGIVILVPLIWTALFHRRWESACVVAAIEAATGPALVSANGDGSSRDFAPLRAQAHEDGIAIDVEPAADRTRVAWSVPLYP